MNQKKKWRNRLISIVLTALGFVFGATWNTEKFCIGDQIFFALGLPTWSNGTSRTHYPAVIGIFLILIGVSVFNSTLQEKMRLWFWPIVVLVLVALNSIFTCISI